MRRGRNRAVGELESGRDRRGRVSALAIAVALASIGVPAAALAAAAPANDDLADAETIAPGGGSLTGTNIEATQEAGEPNHASNPHGSAFHSVWYRWTAPAAGATAIDTCGSEFDTRVGVYTGDSVGGLTEVASNEDAGPGTPCEGTKFGALSFEAAAGTTYRIAIDTSGDLAGDLSGATLGEIKLSLTAPEEPEPEPEPAPDGESDTTSPGMAIPFDATAHTEPMPRLTPERKKNGKFDFATIAAAQKQVEALQKKGLNVEFKAKTKPLRRIPGRFRKQLKSNPGSGGQVIRTFPKAGETLFSTATRPVKIGVHYWDPGSDKRYLEELEREAERKRKKEEEEKRNRCLLLDVSDNDLDRILQARTSTEARKIAKFFKCKLLVAKVSTNTRILKEITTQAYKGQALKSAMKRQGLDFSAKSLKNAVGIDLVQPKKPDFAITWREEPDEIDNPNRLSLVSKPDGNWVLPAHRFNNSTITIQVNQFNRQFVSGARLEFFDAGAGKFMGSVKTDERGEATVTLNMPEPTELVIGAVVEIGSERMEAHRSLMVEKLGSVTTICGRKLTLQGGRYSGTQADLNRCKGLALVPANLGDGRGVSTPRIPTIEQVPALTVSEDGGEFLAGQYNAVHVTGSNTIVGSAPGIIAAGGGNLIGRQAGGNRAPFGAGAHAAGFFGPVGDFLNNIVTNLSRAFNQNVSNTRKALGSHAAKVRTAAQTLAQQGAKVPPATALKPEGVGLISDQGAGVVSANKAAITSLGGAQLISDKGLGLIPGKGLGIIPAGGGNLMPVDGGRLISDKGLG